MLELVILLAIAAAAGWARPRWSSLSVALIPGALAFAWLLLHEDIPGEETTSSDIAWYAGMSLLPAAACALACSLGILARRAARRRHGVTPL